MKVVALALLLLIAAVLPSYAILRLNPKSMSCDSARMAVHEQGAVIFGGRRPEACRSMTDLSAIAATVKPMNTPNGRAFRHETTSPAGY
jgi:hypothetical protein